MNAKITPIGHPIWKELMMKSEIEGKDNSHRWRSSGCIEAFIISGAYLGTKYDTFMPYLSKHYRQDYLYHGNFKHWYGILGAFDDGQFDKYFIAATHEKTRFVFGVFLKNIMLRLLMQPIEKCIELEEVQVIIECCPEWSYLIDQCCEITPVENDIWQQLLKSYEKADKRETMIIESLCTIEYYSIDTNPNQLSDQKLYTKYVMQQ